jgi:hypothetical protein
VFVISRTDALPRQCPPAAAERRQSQRCCVARAASLHRFVGEGALSRTCGDGTIPDYASCSPSFATVSHRGNEERRQARSGPVVAASDRDDPGDDQQQRKDQAPHEPAVHRSPLSIVCEHEAAPDAPARDCQPAPDLRAQRHPTRTTALTPTRATTANNVPAGADRRARWRPASSTTARTSTGETAAVARCRPPSGQRARTHPPARGDRTGQQVHRAQARSAVPPSGHVDRSPIRPSVARTAACVRLVSCSFANRRLT